MNSSGRACSSIPHVGSALRPGIERTEERRTIKTKHCPEALVIVPSMQGCVHRPHGDERQELYFGRRDFGRAPEYSCCAHLAAPAAHVVLLDITSDCGLAAYCFMIKCANIMGLADKIAPQEAEDCRDAT